ncbi:hypothetical protein L1987_23226 [Smallanthus sonchifolius]|uniref:Uncharacterized protein n=1 Tax=Smallanthus sonchifolius TaxID=185202 RepID=A0ACB9IH27_9ASTR|nr:hypothetical protein L1987_23226 [Smallanthus sonchifolius]
MDSSWLGCRSVPTSTSATKRTCYEEIQVGLTSFYSSLNPNSLFIISRCSTIFIIRSNIKPIKSSGMFFHIQNLIQMTTRTIPSASLCLFHLCCRRRLLQPNFIGAAVQLHLIRLRSCFRKQIM